MAATAKGTRKMANDCIGTLKVVAKDKGALKRVFKILNYEDEEFFLSRCRECSAPSDPYEENGFWVQDFEVDGAWNCGRFFATDEKIDEKRILDYEKDANGKRDFNNPIYGTAHLTNLCAVAKALDCGFELYASECGCCFWEHYSANHNGDLVVAESGDYNITYPEDENGEENYDEDPTEEFDIDYYGEFANAEKIYEG